MEFGIQDNWAGQHVCIQALIAQQKSMHVLVLLNPMLLIGLVGNSLALITTNTNSVD